MNKILIIFTNEEKLKEVLGAGKSLDIGDKKTLNGLQIELFDDSLDEAKLEGDEKPIKPKENNNKEELYFVLHTNAQTKFKSKFEETYPQANIEVQSHIEGQFYYTYLPKIEDGSFSQTDLEDFFNIKLDKAINELCDTWSTIDFTDKKAMETLAIYRSKKLNQLV